MTNRKTRLMEFDFFIGADGTEYPLTDGINRFILSFSGLGMPGLDYITQQGPFQHGETLLDYRLKPRVMQLVYREQACSRQEYWENRASLLDALRPNRHAFDVYATGVLRKILPNGDKRDIDVIVQQGPSFSARRSNEWDEYAYTEAIRFLAHNPLIYNPDALSGVASPEAISELRFPADFPISFGTSFVDENITINYGGTWHSFPTISIVGPIDGFSIENQATGEVIVMNYSISSGETVTIDLSYGHKTVTNDDDTNLLGTIEDGGNIDTFHIAPDPEATDGENIITVQGSGFDSATTQITVTCYEQFIGI